MAHIKHGTLSASTVATVTLTDANGEVEVMNRSGSAEIYWTVAFNGLTPGDPAVGGDDCYVVPAGVASYGVGHGTGRAIVKLISSGTPTYSVIGAQE